MAKFSRYIFVSLLVITVIFGLDQLSYENKVFANSRLPCCNGGMCDNLDCDSNSGANFFVQPGKPWCTDMYTITCRECVDLVYMGGQLCPWGPSTTYCMMDGEDCYGWCDGEWVFSK